MGTVMHFEQRASRRTPQRIRCRLATLPAAVAVALGLLLALGGCAGS